MFIILLHESPFYSENLNELFDMILHTDPEWEYYKEELSPDAFSLLQGLLTKDVSKRLGCGPNGIAEVKNHPFFASVNWDDLYSMKIKPFIRPKLRVPLYFLPFLLSSILYSLLSFLYSFLPLLFLSLCLPFSILFLPSFIPPSMSLPLSPFLPPSFFLTLFTEFHSPLRFKSFFV